MTLHLPLSPACLQTTLDYARAQPPFCVDLRPLHLGSDYFGSRGLDSSYAVEWARGHQMEGGDVFFEVSPEDAVGSLREMVETFFSRAPGAFEGAAGLRAGGADVGYQKFSFSSVPGDGLFEISMDYVFVDPKMRGHGFRDLMQTSLFGAALLTGIELGASVRLKFHQVKNPNNVARYVAGGFEPVPECAEEESDEPFACYRPRIAVPLPFSYQRVFLTSELRRRLERP